ncbi:MAG: cell division protein FtsA [Thermotogae bacterium]|nr:MAG: cell division protein FtsA [Thermotogota bacterium]
MVLFSNSGVVKLARTETYAAIDIGSHLIKGVVVSEKSDSWELLAYSTVKSRGIDSGEIKDAVAFRDSISKLLTNLEEQLPGVTRANFVVSTNCGAFGLESLTEEMVISESEKKIIGTEEVEELKSRALKREEHEENLKLVLHVYPKKYLIDDTKVVSNPIDMPANKLAVELTAVVIDKSLSSVFDYSLDDILPVEPEVSMSSLAASEGVLTTTEKDSGVCVLDLGYGSSTLVAYFTGIPIRLIEIPLGTKHIIKDIATVLSTSLEESERLLKTHGSAMYQDIGESPFDVEYKGLDGRTSKTVKMEILARIVHARLREIFNKVRRAYREVEAEVPEFREMGIPGGLVITGGGAKIPRLIDLALDILRKPVRIGTFGTSSNETLLGADEIVEDPVFSAALGSIFCVESVEQEEALAVRRKTGGFFSKLIEVFRNLW